MTRKLGWYTSDATRRPLLDRFRQWSREDLIVIYDLDVLHEMVRFVKGPTGKPAASGYDLDDRVFAAALAIQGNVAQPNVSLYMDKQTILAIERKEAEDKFLRMIRSGQPAIMVGPMSGELDDEEEESWYVT